MLRPAFTRRAFLAAAVCGGAVVRPPAWGMDDPCKPIPTALYGSANGQTWKEIHP